MKEELRGHDLQVFGQIGGEDLTFPELVLRLHREWAAGSPGGTLYGDALCTKNCA